MRTITLTTAGDGFQASFEYQEPGEYRWETKTAIASGRTEAEAIGLLLLTHCGKFGVSIRNGTGR